MFLIFFECVVVCQKDAEQEGNPLDEASVPVTDCHTLSAAVSSRHHIGSMVSRNVATLLTHSSALAQAYIMKVVK